MKKIIVFALSLVLTAGQGLLAQDFAIDKGASIISGTISFSQKQGDLFGADESIINISAGASYNYFLIKGLMLGASAEYGAGFNDWLNIHAFAMGPSIGYAFGKAENKVFPFISIGFRYYKEIWKFKFEEYTQDPDYVYSDSDTKLVYTGFDIPISIGMIVPMKNHIGLTVSAVYDRVQTKLDGNSNLKEDKSIFAIGFGISGLLY